MHKNLPSLLINIIFFPERIRFQFIVIFLDE
jgi:hypothetical protein